MTVRFLSYKDQYSANKSADMDFQLSMKHHLIGCGHKNMVWAKTKPGDEFILKVNDCAYFGRIIPQRITDDKRQIWLNNNGLYWERTFDCLFYFTKLPWSVVADKYREVVGKTFTGRAKHTDLEKVFNALAPWDNIN